uniref:HTH_Tnp_Tc3_2 domain-containing protein n=1 Tax=Rhodnius prolixus TaxID=13249 RepID=T1HBA4_RHOPR
MSFKKICTAERETIGMYIRHLALRNRSITGNEIKSLIRQVRNVSISSRAVRRRLNEGNLRARHPARGPLFTTVHKMTRLQFAREHVNWTLDNWKRVLITDEARRRTALTHTAVLVCP